MKIGYIRKITYFLYFYTFYVFKRLIFFFVLLNFS